MPTDLPNYRILFEENTYRLEDAVNEWIAKGYKPVGRVWVKEVAAFVVVSTLLALIYIPLTLAFLLR